MICTEEFLKAIHLECGSVVSLKKCIAWCGYLYASVVWIASNTWPNAQADTK